MKKDTQQKNKTKEKKQIEEETICNRHRTVVRYGGGWYCSACDVQADYEKFAKERAQELLNHIIPRYRSGIKSLLEQDMIWDEIERVICHAEILRDSEKQTIYLMAALLGIVISTYRADERTCEMLKKLRDVLDDIIVTERKMDSRLCG